MSVFLNKTGRKVDQLKSANREKDYNKSYYIILPKSYIVKEIETTSVFFLTYGLSVMTIWLKENRIFLKNKLLNNLNLWDCHKSQSSTYSKILMSTQYLTQHNTLKILPHCLSLCGELHSSWSLFILVYTLFSWFS